MPAGAFLFVMDAFSYCERVTGGLWAEPLNAVSSLVFAVAAVAIVRQCWLKRGCHWVMWVLALLAGGIAAGSFLWHSLATAWAMWADVIPIGIFINVFLLAYMTHIMHLSWQAVLLGFLTFQLLSYSALVLFPVDFLNGSGLYLPTWLALAVLAAFSLRAGWRSRRFLLLMTGLFSISLLFRTLDNTVCASFPIGTHFAWHLLNAWVLYLAMRVLVINGGLK